MPTSTALAGYKAQFWQTSGSSISLTDELLTDSGDHMTFNDSVSAHQSWDTTVAAVIQVRKDEVQTVTITGSPTGGTFLLNVNGTNSSAIAYNSDAATLRSSLPGTITNYIVTGANGGPWTIEFAGALGDAPQSLIVGNPAGLTGGTSPNVVIARLQAGQDWTTTSSGIVINYAVGQVVLSSAILGTTSSNVRIHSGKYFTSAFVAGCKEWDGTGMCQPLDNTAQQNPSSPWKTFQAGELSAQLKLMKWWMDGTMFANTIAGNPLIVLLYTGANANQRFQGYAFPTKDDIKDIINGLADESLDWTITGQFFFIVS